MVKAGKWGGECVCVPSNGEGGCGCMCVWPQKLFVKWTLFRIHIIQSQSLKYSLASFEEGRGQSFVLLEDGDGDGDKPGAGKWPPESRVCLDEYFPPEAS